MRARFMWTWGDHATGQACWELFPSVSQMVDNSVAITLVECLKRGQLKCCIEIIGRANQPGKTVKPFKYL